MEEDQQEAEGEVEVVEEGGEGVELSQATQLEEFRQVMELQADNQKAKKNLQSKHGTPIHDFLNAQLAFVVSSLLFLLFCLLFTQSFQTMSL